MGHWQSGLEIEKRVCDFKVTLGCLGLIEIFSGNLRLLIRYFRMG